MKKNPIPTTRKRTRNPRAKKPQSPCGTYANFADVHVGVAELVVQLGQTEIKAMLPPTIAETEVARLALPVFAAKALAYKLVAAVAIHERVFGVTDVAPGLRPEMPGTQLLGPEAIARLAILHAELFAPVPPASPGPVNSESRAIKDEDPDTEWPITKH